MRDFIRYFEIFMSDSIAHLKSFAVKICNKEQQFFFCHRFFSTVMNASIVFPKTLKYVPAIPQWSSGDRSTLFTSLFSLLTLINCFVNEYELEASKCFHLNDLGFFFVYQTAKVLWPLEVTCSPYSAGKPLKIYHNHSKFPRFKCNWTGCLIPNSKISSLFDFYCTNDIQ